MAKQKAKPHLQDKSPMFAEPAHRADVAQAHDRSPQDRSQAQDHASDTLVAERDAQQDRRAKGRKQSRGSDTGPKGRKRH